MAGQGRDDGIMKLRLGIAESILLGSKNATSLGSTGTWTVGGLDARQREVVKGL